MAFKSLGEAGVGGLLPYKALKSLHESHCGAVGTGLLMWPTDGVASPMWHFRAGIHSSAHRGVAQLSSYNCSHTSLRIPTHGTGGAWLKFRWGGRSFTHDRHLKAHSCSSPCGTVGTGLWMCPMQEMLPPSWHLKGSTCNPASGAVGTVL